MSLTCPEITIKGVKSLIIVSRRYNVNNDELMDIPCFRRLKNTDAATNKRHCYIDENIT